MSNENSAPYTDTYILDCNRNSSLEAETGNDETPALYTCKQGAGLKLNRGDKVQIHSAFINEIGNTDGTIDVKGDEIKDTNGETIKYTLIHTHDTLSQPFPEDDAYSTSANAPWASGGAEPDQKTKWDWGQGVQPHKRQTLQPYGHHQCDCNNEATEYVLKDNEMNVQVGYYKTANGEGYFHLPRRFDCKSGIPWEYDKEKAGGGAGTGGKITTQISQRADSENTLNWAYHGMQWSGAPYYMMTTGAENQYPLGKADGGWNGAPTRDIRKESMVEEDWHYYDKGCSPAELNLPATDDPQGQGVDCWLNSLGTDRRNKWRNDNSRYQIYKKERTFFTSAPTLSPHLSPNQEAFCIHPGFLTGSSTNDFLSMRSDDAGIPAGHPNHGGNDATTTNYYWNTRDPAITSDWIPYYEVKNVNIEPGFKAPEDIAEEVSKKLNATQKITDVYARVGSREATKPDGVSSPYVPGVELQKVGMKKDGELFKSFYATNHKHFNENTATQYFAQDAGNSVEYPELQPDNIRYMSAYHYIGVKRPLLWDTGRLFCKQAMGVRGDGANNKTWGEVPEFHIHDHSPKLTRANRGTTPNPINGQSPFDIIRTNIPWQNRHNLMEFIRAQGAYPELFDYQYSRIKEAGFFQNDSRVKTDSFQMGITEPGADMDGRRVAGFIHCNAFGDDHMILKDKNNKLKNIQRRLGDDGYTLQQATDYAAGLDHTTELEGTGETATGFTMKRYNISGGGGAGTDTSPFDTKNSDKTFANIAGAFPYYDLSSLPLWFYLDQLRIDEDSGGDDLNCLMSNLCFGCMMKYNPLKEGEGADGNDYIAFHTGPIGGLPDHFFRVKGNPQDNTLLGEVDDFFNLGVDRHFSAYGTSCIMLYSGKLDGPQTNMKNQGAGKENADFLYMAQPGQMDQLSGQDPIIPAKCQLENTYQHNLHTYVGANGFQLNYDGTTEKRFSFSNLHTPEYIGNNYNAGADATDVIASDASNPVYKINKRLNGTTYCPEMVPYQTNTTTTLLDKAGTKIEISTSNYNLSQWDAVYDAHSGISLRFSSPYTYDITAIKRNWHKTLWGLLGFSYDQLHKTYDDERSLEPTRSVKDRLHFNSRLTPENVNDFPIVLTNANAKSSDVSLFDANMYGAELFSQSGQSVGGLWHSGLVDGGKVDASNLSHTFINHPAISVDATSVNFRAERQPTKMLKPYFLIKSNIVGDTKYIGNGHNGESGQLLPIIGVVNKENGFGDYYFQTDQKAVFTITNDTTLSEIVTSIHDPDMSLARVDKSSAVLYLIQKQNTNNLNIIPELVQQKQLNPNELQPPVMTEVEFNQLFETMVLTKDEAEAEAIGHTLAHYLQSGLTEPIDQDKVRSLESFLGLIAGETATTIIGQEAQPVPAQSMAGDILAQIEREGAMTRAKAREVAQTRQDIMRAQLSLRNRFISSASVEGADHTGPQLPTDLRGLIDVEASLPTPRSGLTTQSSVKTEGSKPSTIATAPDEPGATPPKP